MQQPFSRATAKLARKWDAIVVGGGHNGLVAATYLAKAGKSVCVLEKRHLLGGAAVTEEIIPDYHFSRASYVFSLFRPQIIRDLELHKHGLVVYPRDPSSFTPLLNGQSLVLGSDMKKNQEQIAQFSRADAEAYPKYNAMLERLVEFFVPLIDNLPPDIKVALGKESSLKYVWPHILDADINVQSARVDALRSFGQLGLQGAKLGRDLSTFLEFMTAPADKILNRWFESDVLKATLATDAIIGAKALWFLGHALTKAAQAANVQLVTDASVQSINVHGGRVHGVTLSDGTVLESDHVVSNASPSLTYLELVGQQHLPEAVVAHFQSAWNMESASTKINVALNALPNFTCLPNVGDGAMPHHRGTTHFEDSMQQIEAAYLDVQHGYASRRPVIEMNIPTSMDDSIAPPGKHIALLFDGPWNDAKKQAFATQCFNVIEQYAPGFKASIVGTDILTPPDLERVFSLPRGNIFHGAMGLDQLFWLRPLGGYTDYRTPLQGLYLCSAGTHPGGGVMGACGRNAAHVVLRDS
ncbi:Aste57867_19112 [Aphanomyces stellatus]|uniref:Aste57867_19112 protein n=1 Tax=Aphanomyces stellatus TaxID=120398 RepID=A0A485LG28_9STRA|nr:hypothetical protein As57867_019048 [Aphanomyces stellatus]VFT95836.1 Aste57867_19112 [Aphanomyces stellatus]